MPILTIRLVDYERGITVMKKIFHKLEVQSLHCLFIASIVAVSFARAGCWPFLIYEPKAPDTFYDND